MRRLHSLSTGYRWLLARGIIVTWRREREPGARAAVDKVGAIKMVKSNATIVRLAKRRRTRRMGLVRLFHCGRSLIGPARAARGRLARSQVTNLVRGSLAGRELRPGPPSR